MMDANDKYNDKTDMSSSSYKHPIFDGEDTNKFKEWWDITQATMEMEDLEEYFGDDFKYKSMPSKTLTIPLAGADAAAIATCAMNKRVRKEMKKAKAHMVRVTKDYPRRLVMNAETPYKAYAQLKAKYSVVKNRQDFTLLDAQWNEFKVSDVTVDPDKIFAKLDEHSKKLGEFGERYEKDALQMLSKLQVAFREEYGHVFTLLNTAEEHRKNTQSQLETAKRMIKAHYETKFKPMRNGEEDGTMMCMFVSADKQSKGADTYKCEHCGKKGHTAYHDGTQTGLIEKTLTTANMNDCKPVSTPSLTTTLLGLETHADRFDESWEYASIIGMLMYLANNSRPDIAFAVHQCARFTH